jgi:propionyl-CoA carboxylase alpha chain
MIRSLLVANRGEIARRVIATARRMGIRTVAVYSDADADALHVAEADLAVRLPGSAPAQTYLRRDLLVEAALRAGADAVHPGYGFLSENAEFAGAVIDAGLTWVGPPPEAIAAMGSKVEAKALLAKAGVPMLPSWTEVDQVTRFPVLLKASAGGGGRGMRVVHDAAALPEALAAARREAASAFGDDTVFAERYLPTGRHIEVQVFADQHGTVVALGERECSIQRRHQKIVEETPSPAVDPALRERLFSAAESAARAVGYVGAGTVEFLLDPDGEFYFLEMNTRLQVEHPVTEAVTGLDLVRLQIDVAQGYPLPFAAPPSTRGHAIEVRLYAEDPGHDWRPATGVLHEFTVDSDVQFTPAPGIRLDAGVGRGGVVGVHYDPMLAKVIAQAPTRGEAARLLAATLRRARLHGVVTNRDLLVRVLDSDEFRAGGTDTAFLDRHPEVFAPLVSDVEERRLVALAAALAGAAANRRDGVWGALPTAWRNVPSAPQRVAYEAPWGPVEVAYQLDRDGRLADSAVTVVTAEPERVVLEVGGLTRTFAVATVAGHTYVDSDAGSVALTQVARLPEPTLERPAGSLVAPMPGSVGRVLATAGQRIAAGELLLTLEAMKLEHPVHAPEAGLVAEIRVVAGEQVEAGAILAVVTPDVTTEGESA